MKNILICLWGKQKSTTFLQENCFTPLAGTRRDINVNLNTIVDNCKEIFKEHNLDFLWSTWDGPDVEQFESNFKYILKHNEPGKTPVEWNTYLDSIKFPFTGLIRSETRYTDSRAGYYSQFFHKLKILDFLKKNNLKYDGIVFSRVDIYWIPEQNNFNFDKNIIYFPETYWGSRGLGINDHVILGNFDTVTKAMNFNKMEDIYELIHNCHNIEDANAKIVGYGYHYAKNEFNVFSCKSYCRFPQPMA